MQFKSEIGLPFDTCYVTERGELDTGEYFESNELLDALSFTHTPISAGPVLEVFDSEGYYQEIYKLGSDENYQYLYESIEQPDNLMVNIPGDAFPGIREVSLPDIEPLIVTSMGTQQILNSSDAVVSKDQIHKWVASNNPHSNIYLGIAYSSDSVNTAIVCRAMTMVNSCFQSVSET